VTELRLRLAWLIVGALALQVATVYLVPPDPATTAWDLRGSLFILGAGLALVGIAVNRHYWPVWLIGFGFALNLVAIVPHGGYMPITAEAYRAAGQARPGDDLSDGARLARAKDIFLPRDQTTFWFLTDIFPIAEPRIVRGVYSPGDVAIALGAFLLAAGFGWLRREQRVPEAEVRRLTTGWSGWLGRGSG